LTVYRRSGRHTRDRKTGPATGQRCVPALTPDRALDCARDLVDEISRARDLAREIRREPDRAIDTGRTLFHELDAALDHAVILDFSLATDLRTACSDVDTFLDDMSRPSDLARSGSLARELASALDLDLALARASARLTDLEDHHYFLIMEESRDTAKTAPLARSMVVASARFLPPGERAWYSEEFMSELAEIARAGAGTACSWLTPPGRRCAPGSCAVRCGPRAGAGPFSNRAGESSMAGMQPRRRPVCYRPHSAVVERQDLAHARPVDERRAIPQCQEETGRAETQFLINSRPAAVTT
jgi:hypothetical protein